MAGTNVFDELLWKICLELIKFRPVHHRTEFSCCCLLIKRLTNVMRNSYHIWMSFSVSSVEILPVFMSGIADCLNGRMMLFSYQGAHFEDFNYFHFTKWFPIKMVPWYLNYVHANMSYYRCCTNREKANTFLLSLIFPNWADVFTEKKITCSPFCLEDAYVSLGLHDILNTTHIYLLMDQCMIAYLQWRYCRIALTHWLVDEVIQKFITLISIEYELFIFA